MATPQEFVRAEWRDRDVSELLSSPVDALLSVTAAAKSILGQLGIGTVFDLGTSWLFANATAAARLRLPEEPISTTGLTPGQLFNAGVELDPDEGAAELPLAALRGLTNVQAGQLGAALDVGTVYDLAHWPPYRFARDLVRGSVGSTADVDELQTERLRPRFGDHPTERVYYTTLVMLQVNEPAPDGLAALDAPVSLLEAGTPTGFTRPAVGALLTYSQSWYAVGLTLGHLLHSLALAPGEATRIAVIDWTRRTTARASEDISEREALTSATEHARALSEVQSAVANEMQQGGSTSETHASSSSASGQMSVGTGFLTSLWASGDASGAYQTASTDASASSTSWSLGTRSVAASLSQNINDRTEQHSTSARNRRATAVREVSQSEHEQVSTRVVANYNHMHALTVQYYEVVQVYRVATEFRRAERCVFVPFQVIDFTNAAAGPLVDRHRGALASAALTPRARALLVDEASAVEIRPVSRRLRFTSVSPAAAAATLAASARSLTLSARALEAAVSVRETSFASASMAAPAAANAIAAATALTAATRSTVSDVWDRESVASVARLVSRPLQRPGSNSLHLPDDTEIVALAFDGLSVDKVRIDRAGANSADQDLTLVGNRIDLPEPVRLIELDGLHAARTENSPGGGRLLLHCAHLGRRFQLPAIPVELGTALSQVLAFTSDRAARRRELLEHLGAHRGHYTAAIMRSLDSASLVLLLSRFQWNGRRLIDQVEPKPLSVAGNFLVLRAPVEDDAPSGVTDGGDQQTWKQALERLGVLGQPADPRVIPMATNGVFAEAVLGRSNSAEKLEYTRFWNWQDSPIPLQPPEIAPVATGSRARDETLTPGALGAPVLNIVNPTSLPDPGGTSAALQAVATANMFRDMSGLAGTQSLAGEVAEGTLDAATAAGQIASTNMRAQMQKAVAMGQIAADLAKAAMGVPSSGGGNQSVSAEAARVAHGEKRDAAKASGATGGDAASPAGGGAPGGGASGGGSAGGGTPASEGGSGGAADGSEGTDAFRRAVWGPSGRASGDIVGDSLATLNQLAGTSSGSTGGSGALHRGTVVDDQDPQASGRVLVLVPGVFDDQPQWALLSVAIGDLGSASPPVPSTGATVWVGFEGGDRSKPVVLGGVRDGT